MINWRTHRAIHPDLVPKDAVQREKERGAGVKPAIKAAPEPLVLPGGTTHLCSHDRDPGNLLHPECTIELRELEVKSLKGNYRLSFAFGNRFLTFPLSELPNRWRSKGIMVGVRHQADNVVVLSIRTGNDGTGKAWKVSRESFDGFLI